MNTLNRPRYLPIALRKPLQCVIIATFAALPGAAAAQDAGPDHAKPPTPRAAATATAATPSEQSDTLANKLRDQQKRLRERYASSPDAHALAQINAELEESRAERDALKSKKAEVLAEYNARISAVASQGGTNDDKLWLAAHAVSAEETADKGIERLEKHITALKQRRRLIEPKVNRGCLCIPDAIVASTSSSSNIEFAVPEPEPEPLSDADRAHALNYLKGLVAP